MARSGGSHDDSDVCVDVIANATSPDPPPPPLSERLSNGSLVRHVSLTARAVDLVDHVDVLGDEGECSRLIGFLKQTVSGRRRRRRDYNKINELDDPLPAEWWKTGVAFLYAFFNLVFTTVVITVVHERVPDKSVSPPLPDKFFDYLDRMPWAFTVTEVNGLILVGLWFVQWLTLQHKAIIGRRCFFLIGTLYMYRCVTMYITTLPVPGKHMVCAPKLYNDSTGKIWRILRLISGGGLSLTGSHLMCGDFLYSGHTVMLTLSYLFIKEYSPPRWWWYHWFCWLLSASGVVCILLGHEHYSIDVVIGYFATTRLFWWYHAMVNMPEVRQVSNSFLSRTWWNPIFNFLEKNVQAPVPLTISSLVKLPFCRQNYSKVEVGRDE
ncbi:phosphatidylcholine:ceramide cholinephosphotransferase 2 [Mugil cephalus]|uniref:phosphatidylcholine:ceramide cholinephosphotransferase 2 n=1 Tax=Mugil cephalus TaxID=48193 RepID=UPI001FB7DC63|nr:phosphatidylcholine:ceramide cholinephosphotransferase 2 [Mugil cephalus]